MSDVRACIGQPLSRLHLSIGPRRHSGHERLTKNLPVLGFGGPASFRGARTKGANDFIIELSDHQLTHVATGDVTQTCYAGLTAICRLFQRRQANNAAKVTAKIAGSVMSSFTAIQK